MIVPDTSVLVAGFVRDHEFNDAAENALAEVRAMGCLVAHTMAETFSVLSAAGGIYRVEPSAVATYLNQFLEKRPPVQPPPDAYPSALELLVENHYGGGAVYDALIASAAREASAELVSLDRRARPIYELCGVKVRLLDD